jgi:hypothetical protein
MFESSSLYWSVCPEELYSATLILDRAKFGREVYTFLPRNPYDINDKPQVPIGKSSNRRVRRWFAS